MKILNEMFLCKYDLLVKYLVAGQTTYWQAVLQFQVRGVQDSTQI